MTDSYQKLCTGLTALRLESMRESLDGVIDRVNSGELGFVDGMSVLVQRQVAESQRRRIATVVATAHFPSAKSENRLEYRLRHYFSYSLLIIDEVGYLPFDPDAADMLFELIARRYETKSTIITTNKPFGKWGEMLGDPMVANAMLDRLLHHSKVFTITGPSFRTKDYNQGAGRSDAPSADGASGK